MFLASQRDVFGQSTGASHRLGRSSGCFWQVTRMFVDSWTISCWSRPSPWPWSIMFFCVSVRGELKMPCIRTTTHHCSFHECLTWQTFVFQSFCCFVFDWAGATERKWKKSLEKISFVLWAFKKFLALVRLAFVFLVVFNPITLRYLLRNPRKYIIVQIWSEVFFSKKPKVTQWHIRFFSQQNCGQNEKVFFCWRCKHSKRLSSYPLSSWSIMILTFLDEHVFSDVFVSQSSCPKDFEKLDSTRKLVFE